MEVSAFRSIVRRLCSAVARDPPLLVPALQVLISQRVGRRVRCVAPAVGWASVRDSDGAEILEPLERKAFNKWGRERLHVSLCGHAVHFGCWDAYFASLMGRAMANQVCSL